MKKIGFIDYYISEWHANNYPAWIKECCEKYGLDYEICYAYAMEDLSPFDGRTTDEWCKDFGVERCATIAELCEKSDYIIILAPSDPEKHLELAEEAFPSGKITYVDKTFAPDVKTAEKIFELGKKYGTKFFTTSALRYSNEIDSYIGAEKIVVKGGGGNLEEYIIHQAEMVVKVLGIGAQKLKAQMVDGFCSIDVAYGDGRKAQMNYKEGIDFEFTVTDKDGNEKSPEGLNDIFPNLIHKILTFFETGEVDFPSEQTLEVMKLRELAIKAKNNLGEWVS